MRVLYFYQYFTTPRGAWSTRAYEMALTSFVCACGFAALHEHILESRIRHGGGFPVFVILTVMNKVVFLSRSRRA